MAPGKVGTVFVADESGAVGIHHRVPQCAGLQAWLDFEHEALLWGVDPEISREDLERLVEASTVSLGRDEHRTLHSEATDFARWGRRGGLETLRRYGRGWFALLGRRRHGRITPEELRAGLGAGAAPRPA